ncbi:hypothetical protein HO173_012148 [Letharia columbiana]|uniref:Apple domain-containing protein n=1 Tax=Letharia columbiana TaxID=112416 RepID=A0A8H6CQG5_9LECA|nr:uncharacterized protein HO173_012148 [Letharia columbiana]KAF6227619.1 hypothetical protein HO173_012148 [Letharia columbiana]
MDGGLEVDGRNNLPIPCQKHGEDYKYYNGGEQHDQPSYEPYSTEPLAKSKRLCGLRPPTFFLSIALAVSVVLAVVAAGVAGSLAAKRGDTRTVAQSNSSSSIPASNASCPSFNDTSTLPTYSYHINDSPFQPTSNCTSLGSTYTSLFTSASFKLQCGLDLPSNDLYSVFVYYFTDCLEACAAVARYPGLNQTCYGVAFDTNYDVTPEGQYGNCFLKDSPDTTAKAANVNFTSSAVLVGS